MDRNADGLGKTETSSSPRFPLYNQKQEIKQAVEGTVGGD